MESGKPKDIKPNDSVLCFSYVPLLYGTNAGNFYDPVDVANIAADSINTAASLCRAKACLWVKADGAITPVFALERGSEILTHLDVWCEGDIASWFTLDYMLTDNAYVICLHPILERSIERFSKAYYMRTGKELSPSSLRLIYTPLTVMCASRGMFDVVLPQLKSKCKLGIVDIKNVDYSNPEAITESDVRYIGPFALRCNPDNTSKLLQSFIDEMK